MAKKQQPQPITQEAPDNKTAPCEPHEITLRDALAAVEARLEPETPLTLEKFIQENIPDTGYVLRWYGYCEGEDEINREVDLTRSEYLDLLEHLGNLRGLKAKVQAAA